nr:DNA/RNA non-specific endonuclease [Xylanimonas oleitrophica]
MRRLDHPRFTVLLDPARRLAAATAVGIDGSALQALPRTGSWRLDPGAPPEEQAGPDLYHRNDLDRGHLVRRRDPMWGTVEEAREAGEATFVYTNAAPQVGRFNQSKELWNGLEDHVLTYAEAHQRRAVVLTGTVLADDDPVYRGVGIPRRFWKVAAWATSRWQMPDDGASSGITQVLTLASAAFVLDQSPLLDDDTLAHATAQALAADQAPPLGPFRTFQVPVADVAALTGLDLGPLPAADVLGAAVAPSAVLPPPPAVPAAWTVLEGPGDVRV